MGSPAQEAAAPLPVDLPGGEDKVQVARLQPKLSVANGLCFVALVMSLLSAWGIETEVDWHWGSEFGGV